jgi:hypothetical protein
MTDAALPKVTVPSLRQMKEQGQRIAMLKRREISSSHDAR